ncbi:peptide/nickel transport system substrate-binding protein [Friedmanniella luteola]|uniref:Peptide/nickel transport system substrate-binding protein n=1 Tax=Friedmanniella luteola TaxID=546871 RepID=A0A1H1SK96_9ACTN|nr:ABC transporter substrate-binding protein [Friedmanniella luteola]SDS48427.1 peptide/nickel transport system substrate-binding protein [Friedmanniella luteola]
MVQRKALVALAVALLLLLPGCAGSRVANERKLQRAGPVGSGGDVAQLNLAAESDASIGGLVNYNPFAPKQLTKTWLYEPLMIQNSLDCTVTPWLATAYRWQGATRLTFDIRQGVTWSDGSPFTAADVAFTFNLAKKYPAMDTAGVWTDIFGAKAVSVAATGEQVVFEFSGDAASKFPSIISQLIVSERQYGSVGDPTKYVDEAPVATGPFTVDRYNGRRLELVRRPDYWQADKIKVQRLVLEGNYDANQAALKLRTGALDFYTGELPNPQKTFVDADPATNHFWYPPNGLTVLAPNLTAEPFSDVRFREALAYGVDKTTVSLKATYGIMDVASQSGLTLPAKKALLPPGYPADRTVIPFDPARANQLLDAAGYAKGADGFRTDPDGSPISIIMSVQAGFIDYEAAADEVVANLRQLGLDIRANKASPDSVDQQKKTGDFQLMINFMAAGCDYANGMGATLSTSTIPTKTEVKGNVGRYSSPAVDAAVQQLTGSTDPAKTKELVGVLVTTMMTQFPVLPIFYAPARGVYRTDKAVGWPSADDPYANPQDNARLWMTHLSAPR